MIHAETNQASIILGCDHRGREIMGKIAERLREFGQFVLCFAEMEGLETIDYPDIAAKVASEVSSGHADYGILICGTGIGMCVVANKFPGVRAAPCYNEVVAELSRRHNNSNILCLAGDMLGERSSLEIVEKWLTTPFGGGRHQDRLNKIDGIEAKFSNQLQTEDRASEAHAFS